MAQAQKKPKTKPSDPTGWRARRKKTGMTLETFAEKHRFDAGQLSRWETGEWAPTQTSKDRVEAALKAEGV